MANTYAYRLLSLTRDRYPNVRFVRDRNETWDTPETVIRPFESRVSIIYSTSRSTVLGVELLLRL